MALTEFGKAVRKARIDTEYTLFTMAKELDTTPAFLSALETGSKKIPKKWVDIIYKFFKTKSVELNDLQKLANVSNDIVPLDGLSQQQKMLVAGFAKSSFTAEDLKSFCNLLETINKKDN